MERKTERGVGGGGGAPLSLSDRALQLSPSRPPRHSGAQRRVLQPARRFTAGEGVGGDGGMNERRGGEGGAESDENSLCLKGGGAPPGGDGCPVRVLTSPDVSQGGVGGRVLRNKAPSSPM